MDPHLDVGKLVGAASAPVALIIATSIFLGNLGGKYAMLVAIFRQIAGEYRGIEQRDSLRCRSLEKQLTHYSSRLRNLIRATFWLTMAIHFFILTVFFTSVAVILPHMRVWVWVTGFFSLTGLLVLGASVVIETVENHRAKEDLVLETADFPDVLANNQEEDDKRSFANG